MVAPSPILELNHLTRIIDGEIPATLVRDVSLSIQSAEFVAIVGPSGGGKSSLLYLMGLIDKPTSGEVWLEGINTTPLQGDALSKLRLRNLGFIFQFHFLLEEFTALENVMLPMRELGALSESQMQSRATALLHEFNLADHAHKRPAQLSGGMRQRVAVARALANQPRLILADEPTGNLDSKNADIVFASFREIVRTTGAAVVVVTHDAELAKRADRVVQIADGEVKA